MTATPDEPRGSGASRKRDRAGRATPRTPAGSGHTATIPCADEIHALRSFAKAVDAAIVTEWGSRPGNRFGERIAEIRCDQMMGDDDERRKCRNIQKWRDRLVELGTLKAVS